MEEDTEYLKLPLEERCVHKNWKARVNGYEECVTYFAKIDNEKSSEFNKYAPLMKKFVAESNVLVQEKALDAVLSFAENAHVAGKTTSDVIAGIVAKCLGAPKQKTQDKAIEVVLMYCEIEKYELVQEELLKGFVHKNPKVVGGCVKAITTSLRAFGNKVISIKGLVKSTGPLLDNRDKNVREEGKKMVIEMYRWVGPALKPLLSSLKPIQLQELESEFEKLGSQKAVQTRYLRSQQELRIKTEEQGEAAADQGEDGGEDAEELDPYELMESVNILDKLDKEFFTLIEAKKWQERKQALDSLLPLTQAPKLEVGEYGDLVRAVKKVIGKDTNVMLVALASQCLTGVAKGLKKKFSVYAVSCLETILGKFKEKKPFVVTTLKEASDAVFLSTSLESIQEVTCAALASKNPNVKGETASFLARSFCYCTPSILNKKMLKVYVTELVKLLSDSDGQVRDYAAEALGTALKVVGERVMNPFVADVEPLKMQKVKEFSEKVEIKVKISQPPKPKPAPVVTKERVVKASVIKPDENFASKDKKSNSSGPVKKVVPKPVQNSSVEFGGEWAEEESHTDGVVDDVKARVNISDQITDELIADLSNKNWKVRIETLGKIQAIFDSARSIKADIGDLPNGLVARLGDTNKNIAGEAVKVVTSLGSALGPHCKIHVRNILPGLITALGDTKISMRQLALTGIKTWAEQMGGPKEIIDGDMCSDALKSGSPFLKTELITWMSEQLHEAPVKSINKEELHNCIPYILNGLEDRSADIRKACNEAIFPFMLHVGFDGMAKHTNKVKQSSKNNVLQILEKARENLPARPTAPTKQTKSGGRASGKSVPGRSASSEKNPTVAGGGSKPLKKPSRPPSASRVGTGTTSYKKGAEEVDTSPLLCVNNGKQQRRMEEQRMKILRWDFATPRPEFINQLKEQMINADVNAQLVVNMFHNDFKFHIRALDSLTEDLQTNVDACTANLDILLRWLTIRFFDTNPSVILKAMDYLRQVFTILSDGDTRYELTDYEVYAFLPFLIMKFGDPKDAIRSPARNIMSLICHIYPASKVVPYVFEGLKSKNARQRAECLESIGSLIEGYGVNVSAKEIAKQISDRDNSVRNAALNALVQVYYRKGEEVYKMIGHVSDKDLSLLEERIKRSAKSRPIIRKPPEVLDNTIDVKPSGIVRPGRVTPSMAALPPPALRGSAQNSLNKSADSTSEHRNRKHINEIQSLLPPNVQFDPALFEKNFDDELPSGPKIDLVEIPDLAAFISEKPSCPVISSRLVQPGFSSGSAMRANLINANVDFEDSTQAINLVVSQIASTDVNTVITALSQIDELVRLDDRRRQLQPHVDQLLTVATLQFRQVLNTKMADERLDKQECVRIYRSLINCLLSIFNQEILGPCATRDVLHDLVHTIISILLDSRLATLEDGPKITRALNVLAVRLIDKANITHILCALLRLLHEACVSVTNSKFAELVMKCNWKAVKILPNRVGKLDVTQILQEAHAFMVAHPSKSWVDKPSDTPLRTIKTVLHTLVKLYGKDLLTHMNKIPNIQGSELQKYVVRDLNDVTKNSALHDVNGGSGLNEVEVRKPLEDSHTKSAKRLSSSANNALSEIFRKIGSRENTKEGLMELYDFRKDNPEVDIESYLKKSSAFFQTYIERGLKKVEMERQSECRTSFTKIEESGSYGHTDNMPLTETKKTKVDELVDQFKEMAAKAGFDNTYIEAAVKEINP